MATTASGHSSSPAATMLPARECHWTKTYVGAHDVFYKGFREGKGIWGTWEIQEVSRADFSSGPSARRGGERSKARGRGVPSELVTVESPGCKVILYCYLQLLVIRNAIMTTITLQGPGKARCATRHARARGAPSQVGAGPRGLGRATQDGTSAPPGARLRFGETPVRFDQRRPDRPRHQSRAHERIR